jgi:phosphoribosylcarboxyaminoimidazole (NCAIR) mutase
VRILGAGDESLRKQIVEFQAGLAEQVEAKNAALQQKLSAGS